MPVIKSAKKRAIQNEKRRVVNTARKTSIKTAIKKVLVAIENKEGSATVADLFKDAESRIARAKRKIFHPNTASRKVSRLAKRVSDYIKSVNA